MSVSRLSMKLPANLAFRPGSRPFFPSRDYGSPTLGFGTNTTGRGFGPYRKFSSGQVCTRAGHSAAVCHYRFARSFHTSIPRSAAFMCEREDSVFDYDPSVYIADTCPDFGASECDVWYADTGASNHIVSSSDAVSDAHPYTGTDSLMVGIRKW